MTTKRKRFSKKTLEKHLASFGGKCACCGVKIDGASGLEWDHILALELGGEDELSNLQPLCIRDHRAKTKADVAAIAKSNRVRQRNLGIRRPKAPFPARQKITGETTAKPMPPRRPIYRDEK
jgi:5-methylcytosine-specific restriction endonuclease McrA